MKEDPGEMRLPLLAVVGNTMIVSYRVRYN
jgi:hypothetical protein